MAMELHHLHTDGPKPLYKKIAVDEYNRLRDENAELREKVATLEEAQRWRSVSEEKPKDGELVFVRFAERGCGHYFPMDVEGNCVAFCLKQQMKDGTERVCDHAMFHIPEEA